MDYNNILNKAKLEESKNIVKLYEAKYYEALTNSLSLMDEAEKIDTLSKMDERALLGSLKGQVRKMSKQVKNSLGSLYELQVALEKDPELRSNKNPDLNNFYNNILQLIDKCKYVKSILENPRFIQDYTAIDNNTTLFGKNKGGGKYTSKDLGKYTSKN